MGTLTLLRQLTTPPARAADPDRALVDAARRGERAAFDTLVRSHEAQLRGFLARRAGEDAVDDLYQETVLAAWLALSRYDRRSRFKAWLYGIALHKCSDHFRSRDRDRHEIPLDDRLVGWQSPEALYAASELRETIQQILLQVPPQQREVLELYYYADLTLAEIARLLGRNLNTVKYQFYRAHTLVEQALNATPGAEAACRNGRSCRL